MKINRKPSPYLVLPRLDEDRPGFTLTNKKTDDTMISTKNKFVMTSSGEIEQVPDIPKKEAPKKKPSYVADIGFYLLTPILAGVFLGLLADKWLRTKPVLTLAGIGLGTIACFYNLIRILKDE
ncbi:AtpZ/AtpI family protein [Candidatus Roizmanbacteria bacterium]|nr:AtpZ/AtpI family protein [Candidatus Roizmanbacteria bacterium]